MFDVIGDVHGHGEELESLLQRLGYAKVGGVFKHAKRKAVFLGDWIDRGPRIRQTLEVVRSMVEAQSALAVLGNHEFNALAWATPRIATEPAADPAHQWCRSHTEKNLRIHRASLEQLSASEWKEWLNWFRGIPWWLDLGALRCVHACWDASSMRVLVEALGPSWTTTDQVIRAAHEWDTPISDAAECILKGPEIALPSGCTIDDPEGLPRKVIRTKWFGEAQARTYAELCFPERAGVSREPLPEGAANTAGCYGSNEPPVIFGHYWIPATQDPHPLAPNVACVDYSVARGGRLMAYRWSGEKTLAKDHFAWVEAGSHLNREKSGQGNFIR